MSLLLFGSFMSYSHTLYSSVNYLYNIFYKSKSSLDFGMFWHYFFLFNLLQKNFFLLDSNFNKFIFKKFISNLTTADISLKIKFIQYSMENEHKSLELF